MTSRHRMRSWGRYLRALGVPQGLRLIALECASATPRAVEVRAPQLPHPVMLRLHTSDTEAFDGVIRKREYELALANPPGVIFDVGANVGLAAVWFASRFPNARVFALEPEPSNYALLCRNAAPSGNRSDPGRTFAGIRNDRTRGSGHRPLGFPHRR